MRDDLSPGRPVVIHCSDGYALQAADFAPASASARQATVIICPAIFIRQRFYSRFAAYLARSGYHALTLTNRGMGRSLAAETRRWDHWLGHWAELDLPAVLAHARAARPADRLFVVGHSMGGQLVGMSPVVHQLDGIVTVAATAAYWGHWPWPMKLAILAWYNAIPLLGRALPSFPASRLGVGPDVDSRLVRDWARWGRHPRYLHGPFGLQSQMQNYRGRVLAYSFDDDRRLGCRAAVEALHVCFHRARLTHRHVAPNEVGADWLGHFGYFRQATGQRLWEQTVQWIEDEADQSG